MQAPRVRVRYLGRSDYETVLRDMQRFTEQRNTNTTSEIWLTEHNPVFTQGQAGKSEHLLNPGNIPVVQSDRGGQVTYHGPGQLVMYVMLSLREANLGVRALVSAMENTVIHVLAAHGIEALARKDAPGVYVKEAKIAALGLRVKRGYSYHGLSFNIDMDLTPFARINPCGFRGMVVTQARDQGINSSLESLEKAVLEEFCLLTGYRLE